MTMENGLIRVSVDMDRGAHIYDITDALSGLNVLYRDPKGVAHHDVGGWYELFPNAGRGCAVDGAALPKHGDVRDLPWRRRIVEASERAVVIRLEVSSVALPFRLTRTMSMSAGRAQLDITETIENVGNRPLPYLWGHHITFGAPFVDKRCRIDLPPTCVLSKRPEYGNEASRLAPDAVGTLGALPGKDGRLLDCAYFPAERCSEMWFADRPGEYWFNVFNEGLQLGCAVVWDGGAFPALWIWQEHGAAAQPPFDGNTRGLALEPQSSGVPVLAEAVREKRAPVLAGGASRKAWLTWILHRDPRRMAGAPGNLRHQ